MEKLIYFGIGLIGVLAYCLIKVKSLKADAKSAGLKFTIKDYFENDFINILLSIVAVLIWVFVFDETMHAYPKIENFIKLSFIGIGFTGAFILQKLDDRSKKFIRKEIDRKTTKLENERDC